MESIKASELFDKNTCSMFVTLLMRACKVAGSVNDTLKDSKISLFVTKLGGVIVELTMTEPADVSTITCCLSIPLPASRATPSAQASLNAWWTVEFAINL
jgi:hypothetical protein